MDLGVSRYFSTAPNRHNGSAEDEPPGRSDETKPFEPQLMKSLALAVVVALSTIAAGAIAAPADGYTFTVHGVFGGTNYGR